MRTEKCLALLIGASLSGGAIAQPHSIFPGPDFDGNTETGFQLSTGGKPKISRDGLAIGTFVHYSSGNSAVLNGVIWRADVTPHALEFEGLKSEIYNISSTRTIVGEIRLTTPMNPATVVATHWNAGGPPHHYPSLGLGPNGSQHSSAFDVNDFGEAVGYSRRYLNNASIGDRPALWTAANEIIELPVPGLDPDSLIIGRANAISSSGYVVGYCATNDIAIRWRPNRSAQILNDITTTGIEFEDENAIALNEDGLAIGGGSTFDGNVAVVWQLDGSATELRRTSPENVGSRRANAINSSGEIVGREGIVLGQNVSTFIPIKWSSTGEPTQLDLPMDTSINAETEALDLNDAGFAVGFSANTYLTGRAILWTPTGAAIDLNSISTAGPSWELSAATAITNTGWIAGSARYDSGTTEVYLRGFSFLVPFAGTYGLGDANFDESINFNDLLIVAQNYGLDTNGSVDAGDFNLDGVVDFNDLLVIAQNYGSNAAISFDASSNFMSDWSAARAMVPEPSMLMSMMICGLMLKRHRA